MLKFIIGVIIGGIVGFFVCAMLVSGNLNKPSGSSLDERSGEDNAPTK